MLIETTDSNKSLYDRMLEKGHHHPDQQRYHGYRFLRQEPTAYGQMRYWWANDFTSQDSYNATKTYEAQTNAFPTFIRSYRVLRAEYLVTGPVTKGLPFTGVVSVAVTSGGSGYTEDFAAAFTGGSGSGAAGLAIVDKGSGTVLRVELNSVGTGYTGAPSVSFAGGSGTGATATAVIQPSSCVLVAEEHSKLEDNDPYASLYDKVTRTWETLPGPTISSTRIDFDGAVVNVATTKKLISAITSGETLLSGNTVWQKTTLKQADSTLWAYEVVETRTVPGNLIPLPTEEREAGDVVTSTVQLVPIGSVVSNEDISGSNWVRSFGKPFNDTHLVALQITESRAHTGNVLPFDKLDPLDAVPVIGIKQLDLVSNIVPNVKEDVSGPNWTRTYLEPMGDSHLVAFTVTESRVIVGPVVAEEGRPDFDGLTIDTTRGLVAVGSIVEGESISGSSWIRKFGKEHMGSSKVALQITETRPATGNIIPLPTELREAGDVVIITSQLVLIGAITSGETISGSNWVRSFGNPHSGSVLVALQATESRPDTGGAASPTTEERENGDIVTSTRQLVAVGSLVTSELIDGGGNWVRSFGRSNEGSALVVWQIVESRPATGNVGTSYEDREGADVVTVTLQLVPNGSISTGETIDGSNNWIRSFAKQHPDSSIVSWQVTESRASVGNEFVDPDLADSGDVVLATRRLIPSGSVTVEESILTGNTWSRTYHKEYPESVLVAWGINEQRLLPGNPTVTKERDPDGAEVIVTKTLKQTPITTSDAIASNVWTRVTAEPRSDSHVVAWEISRVRPVNAGHAPTLAGSRIDHYTGDLLATTDTIVAASTTGSAVNSSGAYAIIDPINDVVAKEHTDFMVGADLLSSGRTWTETRLITHLPRVLTVFTPQVFDDTNSNIIRASFYAVLQNYNNYYTVTITERWTATAPSISGPTSILPESFSWDTPFGGGQIPECLHGDITIAGSIPGNVIPAGYGPGGVVRTYHSATWSYFFAATTPAGLLGVTVILAQDVRPYPGGGFLTHKETITIP